MSGSEADREKGRQQDEKEYLPRRHQVTGYERSGDEQTGSALSITNFGLTSSRAVAKKKMRKNGP